MGYQEDIPGLLSTFICEYPKLARTNHIKNVVMD